MRRLNNYSIHWVYKPIYNWGAPHCTLTKSHHGIHQQQQPEHLSDVEQFWSDLKWETKQKHGTKTPLTSSQGLSQQSFPPEGFNIPNEVQAPFIQGGTPPVMFVGL